MKDNLKCNESVVATVASFRNFPSENPVKDSVVIFWESHTNNPTDKERIRSTIDLISKRFDISSCEKYEVRTGYLSRYNYLSKTLEESSIEELQEAIIKGEEEQTGWIERCSPQMPAFKQLNWPECISPRKNPYFADCREVLRAKIKEDEKFFKAYRESADAYAIKRHTNPENGFSYLVEENAWIMSLPLLYPNKKIYIIHVGNVTDSTLILFSEFEYLKKSALLLFPSFTHETFASIGDFKIEYENKNQFGYFIDGFEVAKNSQYLEEHAKNIKVELLVAERAEKELLSNIIAQLPGHIYWMNIKGKYIGCNDLQAEHLGLDSRNQIIGKTVFDLLPKQDAIKHNNINRLVIERGRSYSGKEKVSTKDGVKTYFSTKVPLENTVGERVGLLGVSVDIIDKENATALQKQNEARKYELNKQKELQKLAESVAHDIRTPLIVLLHMANKVSLPEMEHTMIRNAVTGIERIVNELIDRYEGERTFIKGKYTCIQTTLHEIIKSAHCQHGNLDIEFKYIDDSSTGKYYFVEGDHSDFSRMLLNLINNAVDAIKDTHGIIEVGFNVTNDNIVIYVKDNGEGMSPDTVQKIMNGQFIISTKKHGHGLGTRQVFDNVKAMNGKLTVTSKENIGTEFKLIFKICETPQWFSDQITLKKGDIVVVLDDDSSIFGVWKRIFSTFGQEISVKYFTKGNDAVGFIKATKNKSPDASIFLIADYELRGQSINGINVIEQTEMQKRSLLVTSLYTSKIKEFNKNIESLKIFPKTEGVDKIKIILK